MAYKLHFSDYPGTDTGPPDPERWIGPPGPTGATGPIGPVGPQGAPGNPFPEAPSDGAIYGRGGSTVAWVPTLPIAGGTLTGSVFAAHDPSLASEIATKRYVDTSVSGTQVYQGGWNAATNTPTMASGALVNGVRAPSGQYYIVTVGATTAAIDGTTTWLAGDLISSNGTIWTRVQASGSAYLPLTGGAVTGATTFGGAAAVSLSNGVIAATAGQNLSLNMGGPGHTLAIAATGGLGNLALLTASSTQHTIDFTPANALLKTKYNFISGPIAFSGAYSTSQSPLAISFAASGSQTAVSGQGQFMQWVVPSDSVQIGTGNGMAMINAVMNSGGGGMTGHRGVLRIQMQQTGASSNTPGTNTVYQGGQSTCNVAFNEGGTGLTSTTASGACYAWNEYARLLSGATNFVVVKGKEINTYIDSGASALKHIGIDCIPLSGHANQGAYSDHAFGVGNGSTTGWRVGFQIGDYDGNDPMGSNSSIMKWVHPTGINIKTPQAAAGIDISLGAISGAAFKSRDFSVSSGKIAAFQSLISQTGTGIAIDIPNYIIGYSSIASGGSGNTLAGDYYQHATTGLMVQLTSASGGVATGASLVTVGYATSNPGTVTVTGMNPDRPGTFVVNVTATLNNTLSLNPSGGPVTVTGNARFNGQIGFNNTAPIARPTVAGACAGNTAIKNLLTALANYGLVVDTTSV